MSMKSLEMAGLWVSEDGKHQYLVVGVGTHTETQKEVVLYEDLQCEGLVHACDLDKWDKRRTDPTNEVLALRKRVML